MDVWTGLFVCFLIGWLWGLVWGASKKIGLLVLVGLVLLYLYILITVPGTSVAKDPWYVNLGCIVSTMIGIEVGSAAYEGVFRR